MNPEEVWKTIKEDLKMELSPGYFNTFITQTTLNELDEAGERLIATLGIADSWHQRMIEERFWSQIQGAFKRVTGKAVELKFAYGKSNGSGGGFKNTMGSLGPLFSQEEELIGYHRAVQNAQLRPDFTFEQFAVSSTNEMAYAAAQAVSKNPGRIYQLLFLFGGVGVGKTHLMQAIGHRVLEKDPASKIMYCSGEEFTNEIIEAIRYKTTEEFRKKYRSMKILMIDDIQFIGGKDKVQEEFFHTFNAVQKSGGQILLTSDQLPQEIQGLEARLRSRFEGGLIIDIQQPNFELRTAILLIKANNGGLKLPMDVAQLIAANLQSTRALEGFLTRLLVESRTKNEQITIEMAQKLLGEVKKDQPKEDLFKYDPGTMLSTVANVFSIKISQLKGKLRKKELVLPRHIAMYLMRIDLEAPLEDVGEALGGRDHTTVIHAVEKITNALPNDERLRGFLVEIRKRLKSANVNKYV